MKVLKIGGEDWYKYDVSYHYEGREYSFNIYARSVEEAHCRIRSLKYNAEYAGEIIAEYPAIPGWIANLRFKIKKWFDDRWIKVCRKRNEDE